jgi:hypothetical protein
MKSYRIKMLAMAVAVLGFSCADDDLKPILTVDQLTVGAYPRTVAVTTGEYDLNNPNTTAYLFEVEFITEDAGENVETYLIKVSEDGSAFVTVRTYGQADFVTNEDGFRSIAVSIPLTEAAALFGKTAESIPALTTYRFEKVITLTDGREFSFNNSSPTVRGPGFQGDFRFDVLVTCPMASSQFSGSYAAAYVGGTPPAPEDAPAFGFPKNVTLVTVAGSTTRRRFTTAYLFTVFPTPVTFNFVCTAIINSDSTVPASCGGPNIVVGAGPNTPFDFNDDSYFELNFIDWKVNGGCGYPVAPFTASFTKN